MFVLESALSSSVGMPQNLCNIIIFNCIIKLLPVYVYNFPYKANVTFTSLITNMCLDSMHSAQSHMILFMKTKIISYYLGDCDSQILMYDIEGDSGCLTMEHLSNVINLMTSHL